MQHALRNATLLASLLLAVCGAASAATYSGNFGDASNTALVGSDLGAASFTDAYAIANNVALYNLVVNTAETVEIQSTAFASGGADPYFSLFQGSGGSAVFLASNYDQAFSTGGDFDYSGLLSAGHYEIALGVSANESFAENYGTGTLADGFIGLGDPGSLGNGSYAIQVTMKSGQPLAAPEIDATSMSTALTLLAGSILVLTGRRRSAGDAGAVRAVALSHSQKTNRNGEIAMNRQLQSAFIICAAVAGLALSQHATAQTTKPILTRDVDRGTAQPVNGACSASFASSVGTCILYSVPAGKRLVVETVSYSVVLASGQYLGSILFGLQTALPYFQVGSPNLYGVSTAPYFNGGAFVYSATQPLRIYLDEGQGFVAGGSVNGGANNYEQDFSFSGFLVDK